MGFGGYEWEGRDYRKVSDALFALESAIAEFAGKDAGMPVDFMFTWRDGVPEFAVFFGRRHMSVTETDALRKVESECGPVILSSMFMR